MFPPRRSKDITEWLQHLLSSLRRGGLEFHDDIKLDELPEGGHSIRLQLISPVPKEAWGNFKSYVLQYSYVEGWKVEQLRQTTRPLTLTFRASSI